MGANRYSLRTRKSSTAVTPCLSASCSSKSSSSSSPSEDSIADDDFNACRSESDSPSMSEGGEDFAVESEDEPGVESPADSDPAAGTSQRVRKRKKVSAIPEDFCSASLVASFSDVEITSLRSSLLEWYVSNYRELPWRVKPRYVVGGPASPIIKPESQSSAGAPYAVWVSEVMSQQTRL